MSKSQLPDVLIPVNKTTMSNVDIYTSILEPVNKSQKRIIFNIRKQGILHSGSRINFTIHPEDAVASAAGDCFLSCSAGIGSVVDTAILRIGTRELSRVEKFGTFYAMKRSVHTASQQTNIDMVLDGAVSVVSCSPNTDGKYAVDTGAAIYVNKTTGITPSKYKLTTSQDQCGTFSLALSDLFPMMKGMMLPLFALQNSVSVELLLKQQTAGQTGKTILFSAAPTTTATTYGLNNINMLIDYLEYDEATMNNIRNQVEGDGLPMNYPDVSLTTTQLISPGQPGNNLTTTRQDVREVGTAGLRVNNIMVVDKNTSDNPLTGDYRSDAMIHPVKFNWRVNDRIIYPKKLENTSLMRSEMEQILEFPMSCPSVQYSLDVQNNFFTSPNGAQNVVMDANVNFMSKSNTNLAGIYFLTGLNLRKGPGGQGTEVINKNVLLERDTTYSHNDFSNRTLDFYVEHERSMVIKGGVVMTSA